MPAVEWNVYQVHDDRGGVVPVTIDRATVELALERGWIEIPGRYGGRTVVGVTGDLRKRRLFLSAVVGS